MHRKNRVVVEYTSSKPLSQKEARRQVAELLDCGLARAGDQPRWWRFDALKIVTKEFERVFRAETKKNYERDRSLYGFPEVRRNAH